VITTCRLIWGRIFYQWKGWGGVSVPMAAHRCVVVAVGYQVPFRFGGLTRTPPVSNRLLNSRMNAAELNKIILYTLIFNWSCTKKNDGK
jgi:hypothetical protein